MTAGIRYYDLRLQKLPPLCAYIWKILWHVLVFFSELFDSLVVIYAMMCLYLNFIVTLCANKWWPLVALFTDIGVGDRGRGHVHPKIPEKNFLGNYYEKFGHFWAKIM